MKKFLNKFAIQKDSSILFITIITNIIFVIILTFINYLFYYNSTKSIIKENFSEYNNQIQTSRLKNIDDYLLNSLCEIKKRYFIPYDKNSYIIKPQYQDISNDYTSIQNLQSKLSSIKENNPYIKAIDIYYKKSNTIITNSYNMHFNVQENEINNLIPWYSPYIEKNVETALLNYDNNLYASQGKYITYVTQINLWLPQPEPITMAVHISVNEFNKYIDETKGVFCIADKENNIIYKTGYYKDNIDIKNIETLTELKKYLEEHNFISVSYTSDNFDITLNYMLPYNMFYYNLNPNYTILVISYIILFVVNTIFVVVIVLINDARYRKKMQVYLEKYDINVKKYNPVENSLELIGQRVNDLNTIKNASEPIIKIHIIRSLIIGRNSEEEFQKICSDLKYNNILCFIVELNSDKYATIPIDKLQNNLNEISDRCQIFCTSMENNQITVINIYNKPDCKDIKNNFENLIRSYDETAKIFIGNEYEITSEAFKLAYESANVTRQYSYIFPETLVLTYDNLNISKRYGYGSHLKLFSNIEASLIAQNYIEFKGNVYMLIDALKNGYYTIDYCIIILRDLSILFYNIIEKNNLDSNTIYNYDLRQYFDKIKDIDEFYIWLCNLCEIYLQNLHQRSISIDEDFKSKLTEYIDKNIENNISLETLAEEFDTKTYILSRTFKQLFNKSYSDYIREKKMKRSLELLEQGISVKDIGERLSYNSTQYFIKIFKLEYGITPYQYYKKNIKNDSE